MTTSRYTSRREIAGMAITLARAWGEVHIVKDGPYYYATSEIKDGLHVEASYKWTPSGEQNAVH